MKHTHVMKATKYIFSLVIALSCAVGNLFAVDKSYYNSLDGKSGTALREALTNIVYTHHTTDLGYNWTFDGIDIVNGEILDIYSTCTWTTAKQGGNYSGICDSYNREHVVPQSLFKEAAPQKGDRHHLFLADGQVNNLRSSYPFGETSTTTAFSGYSNGNKALGKLGTSSSGFSGTVYEPDDEYKGDIARAIMYMAIRYATSDVCKKYGGSANSYPVTSWNNAMFSGNLSTNYGLSANAVAMYMKWHRADPPSAKEIARNNGVEAKQGNRNPFVDLPDLAEYLWGTHKTDAVELSNLTLADGSGSVATTYKITLNRNGSAQTVTCTGTYTLPTSSTEADACEGWSFVGWTTTSSVSGTTAPTWITQTTGATTLYAVYGNASGSAPLRQKMADVSQYEKVSSGTVASGQYLIVYEDGSLVFDGSLTTLDATNNKQSVTISDGAIASNSTTDGYSFTITNNNNSYTIQSASGYYIGATGNSNSLNSSTSTAYTNSITINNGNADIVGSGGAYLRYNSASDQARFRYFKSSSYTGQKAIQLYKKTTSSGGGGGSTTTYMTSPTCGDPHTITLSSGGTVTGGEFEASASSAYAGATITLSEEASAGYTFGSWTVTKQGGGSVTVTDNQFVMPDANVTVSATFTALPTYNIRFYNNGTQLGTTQSIYQGGYPDVPSDPSACEGYTFVGWWTNTLAVDNTTSKTWVEDFTVSGAQDYYAIFSKTETSGGGGSVTTKTDELTRETTGVTSGSTNYSTWSGKSGTSGAVYAGNSAGGNDAIQLRTNNSNSGIITTTSGGKATKIAVTWQSNTSSGRTIDIYGKSSAYSSASDLYDTNTQGTKIGSIVYGTSTELTISGEYTYIGIRSNDGALYLSNVSITWSSGSGSSTTYYTSSPDCSAPIVCELTGITLNTEDVSLNYTTGDVFSTDELIVTANYSNCADAIVTPTSISDPDMSSAGTKTITVTYTENGVTKTASFDITVSDPVTYIVTWSVNGVETAVVYNEDDYLVLPSTPSDCEGTGGKKFVGWTAQTSISDGARPADLFTMASGLVTADVTYYAVYATATTSGSGGSSNDFELYSGALTEGDYLIVYDGGAMNTTVSSSRLSYATVTPSNDVVSTTEASIIWHIAACGNYWTIYNATANQYAGGTTTKNQGAMLTEVTDYAKWIVTGTSTYDFENLGRANGSSDTGNKWLRKNGTYGFACYASGTGGALSLYKKASSGTTTYSDYSLECNELCALTSITLNTSNVTTTFTTGDTFTSSGLVVTANYSNCDAATVTPTSISSPNMNTVGQQTITVTYTENGTTKTATYTITVNAPVSYTITLDNSGSVTGGTFTSSQASATAGTVITLTATPATEYRFVSWSVTGATPANSTATTTTFTMPAGNVTVSATFEAIPQYTIRFFDGETKLKEETVREGQSATPPANPAGCTEYTFVGWWTSTLAANNTTSHTWVTNFTASQDQDYYAVYRHTATSGGESTAVLLSEGFDDGQTTDLTGEINSSAFPNFSGETSKAYKGHGGLKLGASSTPGYITSKTLDLSTAFTVSLDVMKFSTETTTVYVQVVGVDATKQTISTSSLSNSEYTNYELSFSASTSASAIKIGTSGSGKRAYLDNVVITSGSSSTTYYTTTSGCCQGALATPVVTANPGNGKITLTWADVTDADHYTVTIGKGVGFTTECGGEASIGDIINDAGINTCIITGLTNGLEYTTSVVANGTTVCDGAAAQSTTTPMDCNAWDAPTLTYSSYALAVGSTNATLTISGTQHGTPTFSSSNVSVLTVDANGEVTPVGAGTATITAHWEMTDDYCEKDIISSPFTVSGPLTITFNANDGTDEPATKTQTVTYNVAATLDANTFTRTGYVFQGWATTASGAKVHNDGASVTFTESTVLYAVWQINSHNVTFTSSPTGATVNVNGQSSSPQSAEYGSIVSVAVTPAAHYTLYSIEVSNGASVTIKNNTGTFTMPDEDVTVTVTMTEEAKYTVNWYVAGTPTAEQKYAGEALAGITAPTRDDCDGTKVFVGWTATADYNSDDAPADLFTDASTKTMPVGGTNYYAVFATEVTTAGGGGSAALTKMVKGDTFADGDKIVIVANNTTVALYQETINTSYVNKWTFDNNAETVAADDKKWLTVTAEDDAWYLGDDTNGYINNSSNNLYCNSTKTAWTLHDNGDGTFGLSSNKYLSYRSDLTNLYWRGGGDTGASGNSVLDIYKYTSGSTGTTTTYSGYTTSCVTPTEVTVSFNANGGEGTMSDQTIAYNEATALSANTFTRTSFVFSGWATSADGSKIYDDEQPVTLTRNITLYAVWTAVCTIRFYVNGTKINEQTPLAGETVNLPSDPTGCTGYSFVGWWTSELTTVNTTSHTWVTGSFAATESRDYYAVYSLTETTGEGGASKYVKVTSTSDVMDGQYLIVYESESGNVAFDGGRETLDAVSNTITVTISDAEIAVSDATTAAEFTINASAGRILSTSGKYIGQTSDANGLVAQDEALSNTITIENGVANIVSGGAYLRYNSTSNQLRFRYYKSSSYTGQQAIQLYKKTGGSSSTTYYTTAPDCTIPEVSTSVVMVTELNGISYAASTVITDNQAEAIPLLQVGDKYFYTSDINVSDITWQLVERKGSYYIKDASGAYLTVIDDALSLADEPYTWLTSEGRFVTESGSGLCYSAANDAFVVSTEDNQLDNDVSASIQRISIINVDEAQHYSRDFAQADNYATLCLPYAVASPFVDGVIAFSVTGKYMKDEKITGIVLTEVTDGLNAGQPYVILSTTMELKAWYGEGVETVTKAVETIGLVGNLSEEKLTVPIGCYGLSNNQLRRIPEGYTGNATVGQYKAYFDLTNVPNANTLPMSAASRVMQTTDADAVETAVDDAFAPATTINWNEPVYNVLGQRVGKDAVGVLIQNGMKFLIP